MPFIDANSEFARLDGMVFDQVVVGAGAAGILIARRLAERGRRVLLLESGHFQPDDERQALNVIEQVGKPLGDAVWTRKRVIAGTTTAWGGQSVPLPRQAFEALDWIPDSGWPVGYQALASYYDAANRFMGVHTGNYDSDLHKPLRNRPPAFDPAQIDYQYSKWARQPNFFTANRQALERDVVLLFNAQLLRIDLGEGDRVRGIEVGNFDGGRRTLTIDGDVVLAVGGIETSRALLLNDHQRPQGLGGEGGWLGRAFMEHPCIEAGVIRTDDPYRLQAALGTRLHQGSRYGVRLCGSEPWQVRHRALGAVAACIWLYEDGDVGPLAHLRGFVRKPSPERLFRALGDAGRLAPGLWALATEGLAYKPGATARLAVSLEQSPSRDSRIDLGDSLDVFGQRRARLDWRIGHDTWTTLIAFVETLKQELARLGLGEVALFDQVRLDQPEWADQLSDVNHHMGGARMSVSPDTGVVDTNLAVWGTPNLYVCSAAVFPTGHHSNPTLTVLALGERLAERLAAA